MSSKSTKPRWIAIPSVADKYGREVLYIQFGRASLEEVSQVGPEAIRKDADLAAKHAAFRVYVANVLAGMPRVYEFSSMEGTFTLVWHASQEYPTWYGPELHSTTQFQASTFKTIAKLAGEGWRLTPEKAVKMLHAKLANRSEDPASNWTAITPAGKYDELPVSRFLQAKQELEFLEQARSAREKLAAVGAPEGAQTIAAIEETIAEVIAERD